MKKVYKTLEIVCHRDNQKDERLILKNGKYSTAPIVNTMHMSSEGYVSMMDKATVDLFKGDFNSEIELPQDIESLSLVLVEKTEYISKNCSIIETSSREVLTKLGCNLFVFDDSCNDTILVNKDELASALRIVSKYDRIAKLKLNKTSEDTMKEYIKAQTDKQLALLIQAYNTSKNNALILK